MPIMELAGWENPAYDTDLEPPALKRLQCHGCLASWAEVQCQSCDQQYCRHCEAKAHSKLSDPAAHNESLGPCNVCQDCQTRGPDFYCMDCARYQCEQCCAVAHGATDSMRTHALICTEGAPTSVYRYNTFPSTFKECVKEARRSRQQEMEIQANTAIVKQETGVDSDFVPLPPADDADSATTDDEEEPDGDSEQRTPSQHSVEIKMERVRLNEEVDAAESVESSGGRPGTATQSKATELPTQQPVEVAVQIKSETAIPAEPEQQASGPPETANATLPQSENVEVKAESLARAVDIFESNASHETAARRGDGDASLGVQFVEAPRRTVNANDIVDLTGDDDDNDANDNAENIPPLAANSANAVKKEEEPVSTTRSSTKQDDQDDSDGTDDFSLDTDPIRSTIIREYNTQTRQIHATQQRIARVTQRATSASSFQHIRDCQQQLDTLKNVSIKANHARDATIARLLVFLRHGDADFHKLLHEATLDIPDAQAAIHRECVRVRTQINQQGRALQARRHELDEAIRMKPTDSFSEVIRLGSEIATIESSVRQLETQRLDQLQNLGHVSEAVRSAARAMMKVAE